MATQDVLSPLAHRVVLGFGVALIGVLLVATVVVLAVLREEALQRSGWHLENLARALGEQIWQSVHTLDLLGRTTADELSRRDTGRDPLAARAELARRLEERLGALPGVRMLAYLDPQGALLLHVPRTERRIELSDREHFRAHLGRRMDGLYIGAPVIGRLEEEWLNVFSYRAEDESGAFRGVVLLAASLNYFQRHLGALDTGEGGRVLLFRDDGVLLASHPPEDGSLGRTFARDPLFESARDGEPGGVSRRAGVLDREPRIIAHRRLTGYPLLVVVSSRESAILAAWRRDAVNIGLGAAGAVALVSVALFFLMRQFRVSTDLRHDLDETAQQLQGVIQSAMDAIITVDANQNIVLFNAAAEQIFRCGAGDVVGKPLDRLIPERFREAHRAHIERFGATGSTTRMMGGNTTLYGLRADGEEFPIDASISQVTVRGARLYTVILRDITRRKQAEDELARSHRELRNLSAVMHEVREAERLRIARELHDELAQWLTAIKMDLSWLSSRLPREPAQLAERAERAKGMVDTTVAAVRRIAADLRPVMLDDLGLVAALEHLLHDLSQRTGVRVSLDADEGVAAFGEPLPSALYRIAQEALTNVARHAQATEVKLSLKMDGEQLVMAVSDDGRGFDPATPGGGKSYGLLGIRERAYTLGGSASIESGIGRGTRVEVAVPVARYRRREATLG